MRTILRKIGNSRGVLIPAALLAESRIGDEIELTMENGKLVIAPVPGPRAGWFNGIHGENDEDAWEGAENLATDEEWEW